MSYSFPAKYNGDKGPFNMNSHIIQIVHPNLRETLAKALNCSQSRASWTQFNSVVRCLTTLEQQSGISFSIPWSESTLLSYIVFQSKRGLRMASVKTYLSRIRAAHRFLGYKLVESEWVWMLFKGLDVMTIPQVSRLAMTPDKMLLLKQQMAKSSWGGEKRRLVWMAACFAFHGALRSSEYLPVSALNCNPSNTLLVNDVKPVTFLVGMERVRAISLVIKEPKELKSHGSKVSLELFQTGDFMCPCQAYDKYLEYVQTKRKRMIEGHEPLFMYQNAGYTRNMFNSDIKSMLSSVVDYSKGKLSSHSFRSGLATAMARAGFTEEEIMLVGRWTSEAYLSYIKQGRTARFETMRQISSKMTELSRSWSPGTVVV